MILKAELDRQPDDFLRKAERELAERLIKKIEGLRSDPFPQGVKRVIDRREKTFRVRVGDYLILYVVYLEESYILISKIDKRPQAY